MSLAAVSQVTPEEWIITGTVAGSAAANTRVACTIQRQAGAAALATQQAPFREVWHIHDIYYVGAAVPAPDCQLIPRVDSVDQSYTPLASSVHIATLTRLTLPMTIPIPRGSVASFDMINLVANALTTAVVVTFKAKVIRRIVTA